MAKRIHIIILTLVILGVFSATGFGGEPKFGGTITFAVATTPPTLDTQVSTARAVAAYAGIYIWEGLTAMDEESLPRPMLADQWEVSKDGLKWTFYLRKGVAFQNGKEMTSEDVVASLNRWRKVSARKDLMVRVKEVKAADKYTVEFLLDAPLASLPFILAQEACQPVIHPKEIIENAGPNELSAYIGTGPYKFVEWIPGRHIILERFDNYKSREEKWGGLAGKKVAYADKIVFKNIPEAEVRLAGLKTGEFDGTQPLPQEYLKELEQAKGVRPVIIKFDMKPTIFFSMDGIMKDVRLRKAIRAALNMDDIMFAATGNDSFYDLNPDQLWFRSKALWSDTGKEVYNQHNIELAKQLAQEAGYKNEPIRFLASATQFHHRRPAIMITEQLREAGFNIFLDLRDWPTVVQQRQDHSSWDIHYTRTVLDVPSDVESVRGLGFNSPETQKLIDTISTETDMAKLRDAFELFKKEVIVEQVPWITMGDMFALRGERDWLKGLQPIYIHPLWNVWLEK